MSTIEGEIRTPSGVELFYLAKASTDHFERLAYLQHSAEAFAQRGLTIEDVGIPLREFIQVANRSYGGSAPEASAIHTIVCNILSSLSSKARDQGK